MADVVMQLNEMTKTVYSKEKLPNLVPDVAKIQKSLIKFEKKTKLGGKFSVGVRLSYPQGFTHKIADGSAGAFALNDVKGSTQKKAEMTPYQLVLRDQMSYEDAGKATGNETAFVDGVGFFYEGLQLAGRKRVETGLIYGGEGIGKVGVYTASNAAYDNQPTVQILQSEWAPQIWAGCEGAEIDLHSGSTSTVRATVTITGVDIDARTIVLSAVVTGAVASDKIFFKGCFGNEAAGIHNILSNTGTQFGISAAQYSMWKANQVPLGNAAFSFAALKKGISKGVGKGLFGKIDLLVNPGAWDDLQTNIETLYRTDKSQVKKVEIGAEEIVYRSQNGETHVHAHPMVKEGYAYGLFTQEWSRVGSVDFALGAPGFKGQVWFNLPNNAGVEARAYTNQGMICKMPAVQILFTGIKNTTLPAA